MDISVYANRYGQYAVRLRRGPIIHYYRILSLYAMDKRIVAGEQADYELRPSCPPLYRRNLGLFCISGTGLRLEGYA